MDTLKAEKRDLAVKAKKLRREGYVTGNVFGREIERSIPVQMKKLELEAFMKGHNKGSQILLDVEGQVYDVLIKEVDYNAMQHRFDEIDFQALVMTEKVRSVAEVVLVNHDKIAEGVLEQLVEEITYKALPSALVDKVSIDVGDMKIGDKIHVGDLAIASNPDIQLVTEADTEVVRLIAVKTKEEKKEATEETEEAADKKDEKKETKKDEKK
ncbi:MAG: 50S ribosomal protein L25 [Lachnospiraceae bacterium]|nr:50S ribosomal protein L25 [Lachnospiraceae bacterium]